MEATGNLVPVTPELAARVELAQYRLYGGHALEFGVGHRIDGDTSAVVTDFTAPVREQRDHDLRAVACHGLVHGIVDDLVDQVVKATNARRSDVHARSLAHMLEALKGGDGACVVSGLGG